jgi:ABC-type uncharacterized transport system permease subunit
VPLIAALFAAILAGSTRLKIALQLDQSLAGVVQGILVLIVILSNGLRGRLQSKRSAPGPEQTPPPAPPEEMAQAIAGRGGR